MTPAPPTARRVWLLGVLSAGLFIAMATQASGLDPGIPCLQLTFTRTDFDAILTAWGDAGIARFRQHFFIDFPFLISYGLFGHQLATRTLPAHPIRWLLPAAALLDASENLLHLHLTAGPPAADWLYPLAGTVASGKWLLIGGFVVGMVGGLVKRRFRAR